ncbi:MAG: malate synthase A [Dehalococcoidia bacterium]|nr:malate synthase A [Dehalococcoidia bacterium]MDW8120673.1 malate synthase A [Chloroflexota bacterium]
MTTGVIVLGKMTPAATHILTPEAQAFLADLAREFEAGRRALLQARVARQAEVDQGHLPDFRPETRGIREQPWRVPPAPKDLLNRRVEITGPTDRKMFINALNSGANIYMTDFEDAHSPAWEPTLEGQLNIYEGVRRTISFQEADGRVYRLNPETATLCVRPRGIHLPERHLLVDGQPIAGFLFDVGLFLFHNAHALLERGSGPYLYIPKLQGHLEARWVNQVLDYAEERLGLPKGCIRVTVLIEHIWATFEMEEILYQLRSRITGLNLGRWDYIFSVIKTFRAHPWALLPDRSAVTMTTPFLKAAAEMLVAVCHKRGAHALGGMSAYIPRRGDPGANERALAQVRADKEREAAQGFDGAWVAHPDLVPVVREVFDRAFSGPHQLDRIPEVRVTARDLLDLPKGDITEAGVRNNISVSLLYLQSWLLGRGAAAIYNLMEDTATAEIARSQIWQWLHFRARLADGRIVTPALYYTLRTEEAQKILQAQGHAQAEALSKAVDILDSLVTSPDCVEFLTLPAYRALG